LEKVHLTYANTYAKETFVLSSINITTARKNLYKLVESLSETHEPIHITGKSKSAVLVGEDDWRSIEETLYLLSIPGMRDSILKGMKEPLSKASTKATW
jgi:prevent-host-death family protein